jgi:transglutaminase-like putative cysteine protease
LIFDVTHVTRYRYGAPVGANSGLLRLLPRSDEGQTALRAQVEVIPRPESLVERLDAFGNRVLAMRIETPHVELIVKATSRVAVDRRPPPLAGVTPPWEIVARQAAESQSVEPDSPALAIFPSRLVDIFASATAYAGKSFTPGRAIYDAASALNARIKQDFVYDGEATEVTTSPAEAFAKRRGVCQDFSHVMIACLRGLGLPALYVSGYIRTLPPPGKPRLEGADASHAWVALWCGPRVGWVGLDPTNAIPAGDDHVVLAQGRDYAEASPMEGVILSSGGHELEVEVDVLPVE